MVMKESELVALLQRMFPEKGGIGNDCAYVPLGKKRYLLLTTDALVEDVHFKTRWQTPEQVGKKAIEQNVSDIAACGGIPKTALVSLIVPKKTADRIVKGIFKGIKAASRKYGIRVMGGNLSRGSKVSVTITMTGAVERQRLCLRSNARIGDRIYVTGTLGKGLAGLNAMKRRMRDRSLAKHYLEPKARLKEAREISRKARCMIDISDGLASEINHICKSSNVGARIHSDRIPISSIAKKVSKNPLKTALESGDEFELLFTTKKPIKGAKEIGEIVPKSRGVKLILDGKERPIKGGYRHF